MAAGGPNAEHLEAVAEVRRSHPAGPTLLAERERPGDAAIAGVEAAPRGRLGHLAEDLVADDAALRHTVVEVALEDVQVGPADADALDPQQGLAGRRRGRRHRPGRERSGALIECGAHPGRFYRARA